MEQRPWLKNYPDGVPANVDYSQFSSVKEFLKSCFEQYRKRDAFYCMGKTLTYGQVDKLSDQFGAYLHSRGLVPGDKIAIMMPNLLQYPVALFGAIKAGLIVVNTNPLYTPREMHHQFTDSDVEAIVIAENFAANLEKIVESTQIKTIIITSIGELLGPFKKWIVNFVVRTLKRGVPKYNLVNTVTFSQALKGGSDFTIKDFEQNPDDVVVHQYTGGTTGTAKGAMLTNENLIANTLQTKAFLAPYLQAEQEVVLNPLPLYHIFAFTICCMALLSMGAMSVLVTNPRNLPSVIKEFKKNPISIMIGVNTLFNALLHHKDFAGLDFSNLKVTVAGGMALQKSVAERWKEVTGCTLSEGYGLTETSPVLSINPLDEKGQVGTIGIPIPSTDMRIVDEHGNTLPPGEAGEIQAKGPQVMKGYYNKPEETANVIHNEWFSTGDIGLMRPDGFFQIVDRKKDMILVSGFNVYPNEVEDVIAAHSKVLEVCAIGIPDDKSGEVVKVYVVKRDSSLTEEELLKYCRDNLTGYKVPKTIEFRMELPKSNVGKILRRKLREEALSKA